MRIASCSWRSMCGRPRVIERDLVTFEESPAKFNLVELREGVDGQIIS